VSDNFDEFFDKHAKWTEHDGEPSSKSSNSSKYKSSTVSSRKRAKARLEAKKRRRRAKVVLSILLVFVLAVVGYFGYSAVRAWKLSQNSESVADWPGPGFGTVEFTIDTGEGAISVANKLVKANVVKSQSAFTSAVSANNKILYPGVYSLKKHMAAIDVVNILSDQTKAGGFLEVRAGDHATEVLQRASSLSGISMDKFKAALADGGAGILPPEAKGSIEGWLEPGVYNVRSMKSAEDILSAMVKKRIAKLDSLGIPKGDDREKALIMASIAEAEVNNREYYGKVVRVILNRLAKDMPLGMDSTIGYGAGVKPIQLTQSMLDNPNNPYNTRIHKGLTPTPIGIAGDNALLATIKPQDGPWLYFVTTNLKTGETKFADNKDDFLKFRDEYKRNNPEGN
jgi:hypothetical protein